LFYVKVAGELLIYDFRLLIEGGGDGRRFDLILYLVEGWKVTG
jgi:hypothetical protein